MEEIKRTKYRVSHRSSNNTRFLQEPAARFHWRKRDRTCVNMKQTTDLIEIVIDHGKAYFGTAVLSLEVLLQSDDAGTISPPTAAA
ncbi:hypothetical protein BaRGS_00035917 [Batillaria attramentaria]|uniref:Uncharacterized protein n=1 Tax=Batillaria attramentaria TaxID=370345 RepID=A0ABD0JDD7_9CAEN